MAYRVRSVRSAVFRKERNENGVVKMVSLKRRSKLYIPPIVIYVWALAQGQGSTGYLRKCQRESPTKEEIL